MRTPRSGWQPLDLRKGIRGQRARRLSPQQIDEVRQALTDGATPQELALKYAVTASAIRRYRPA